MKRWHVLERLIKENGFKVGAELGVYKGRTFIHLLTYCPGLTLYGVDLFSTEYYHSTRKGRPPKRFDLEGEYKNIQNWLNKSGKDGHLIQESTLDAAHRFNDASLDFVFVDADHRYEPVCADLDAWMPKVRTGGMIIGHDWNEAEFPGVIRAAKERFDHIHLHGQDHVWSARL